MRALFAWELGKNFGHVTQIIGIAKALHVGGWEIFFALKTPAAIQSFDEGVEYKLIQAPYSPVRPLGQPGKPFRPLFYPDELVPCGYDNPRSLAALVKCWRDLFDLVQPDVLIEQSAPTALLASKDLNFARVSLGRGYDMPYTQTPMPAFRFWDKTDPTVLERRERWVLSIINKALSETGSPTTLKRFAQLLEVDRKYLCTIKELDHYPERSKVLPDADYLGPFSKTDSGTVMDWRNNARKRILAYLQPNSRVFGPAIRALHALPGDYDIILAAPSITSQAKEALSKSNLRISENAVRLDRLLPDCDLGINHASSGICSAFALNGTPMLMFPTHVEQNMFARTVCRNGVGEMMDSRNPPEEIRSRIEHVLAKDEYRHNARLIADKYRDFNPASVANRIARDIQNLVSDRTPSDL